LASSLTTDDASLVPSKHSGQIAEPQGRALDETLSSDETLMGRLRQGDREALASLFRRYSKTVRSVAFRILRDVAEADDLVQEVFLFIHRKSQLFDETKSSARSWIVQMTYHRAIDRRRYLQSRHFYTHLDLNGTTDVIDRHHGFKADMFPAELVRNQTFEAILDTLSEDQRNTLVLHFVEGFTFAEVAAKLDQSAGNVRNHYYRGLEKLRKQMFSDKLPSRNGNGKK